MVQRAVSKGLQAVALTDHDTVSGLEEFHQAGCEYGVETISGVEITAEAAGREVHMLGYFVDIHSSALIGVLKEQEDHRLQRLERMIAKLRDKGLAIADDDLAPHAESGTVGRPHLAMILVEKGYASSIDDAFAKYLGRSGTAYVEKPRMPAREAIALIRSSGGVAVLAHPAISHVDSSLRHLVDLGLQGLEVWHISHSAQDSARYLKVSENLGLLPTGGSDCHGRLKGAELMGKVRVSYDRLESLKKLTRTDSGSAATPDRDF